MKQCYTAQWLAIVFLDWLDNYVRKYSETIYHEKQTSRGVPGAVSLCIMSRIYTREYKFVIHLFVLLLTKLTPG